GPGPPGDHPRRGAGRGERGDPARPPKNRRRRRRAAAETVANHELPPKPTPGPLVEPVIKPAPDIPELRPVADPQVEQSHGAPSRRPRRSSRPKQEGPAQQAGAGPAPAPARHPPATY